jgi:NitT/TauT family transport system ATP-binding protein
MTPVVEVTGLHHAYDGAAPAVADVSFAVEPGELVCIVGPSGCGKSTLLRVLAGLIAPTAGSVVLRGEPVTGVPDGLAVVFQDYGRSLFPWLTVSGNVEFPLRGRVPRAERRSRAADALADVGLAGRGDLLPAQLSGGMQQRVAIARALASRPTLMLMDEPFASVDAQTRSDLEDLVLRVRREHGVTVLVVTHDIDESVYLADRVMVLSPAPATVVRTLDVPLGADRDQISTRSALEFVALRTEIARLLRADASTKGSAR